MKLATDFSAEDIAETPHTIENINGKPALLLPGDGRLISDFADELGELLNGHGIFNRKGAAFTLDHEGQRLKLAEAGWLRTWVESQVVPFKKSFSAKSGEIKIVKTMAKETADAVLVSPQFLDQLPQVERFHPCPMPWLRDAGKIELLPLGLDHASGTFTSDPGFQIEAMQFTEAKAEIETLLAEFPWAEDAGRSKAVAIGAMLTTFAGGLMPAKATKPVFIYTANAEGSGKTTLAQLAGTPYADTPAEAAPRDETEWQKKLLSLVISGRRLVLLDNLKGYLDSPSFEGYTTSATFGGRILGGSREFTGEAGATILITGNGLTYTPDLRRRALIVELFMRELRAEDRSFRRRLTPATITAMRSRILSALWGIVTAWNLAGRPPASRMNTSFPEWCETIGGMVEFAGWGCPTAPAQIEGAGDTDTADFAALAAAMNPGHPYEFDGLTTISEDAELFDHILSDKENGSLTRRAKKRLSAVFKRFSGRRVTASGYFEVLGKAKTRRYMIKNGNDGNDGNDVSALLENSTFSYGVKHHADHADHVAIDPEDAAEGF
jgi:hypothetical protein